MKKKTCQARVASSKMSRVLAAAVSQASKKSKSWFDKLKTSDQKWIEELRVEYMTGNHPSLNATSIAKAVSEELGTEISGQAMRSWLRKTK